jgi:hypothetical protein
VKVLSAAVTLFVVLVGNVFMFRVLPADPAKNLTHNSSLSAKQLAAIKWTLGLPLPLPQQFWNYLVQTLHGNLGRSFVNQLPTYRRAGSRRSAWWLGTSAASGSEQADSRTFSLHRGRRPNGNVPPALSADQIRTLLVTAGRTAPRHRRHPVDNGPASCPLCPFAGNSRNANITRLKQPVREPSRVRLPGGAAEAAGPSRTEGDEA